MQIFCFSLLATTTNHFENPLQLEIVSLALRHNPSCHSDDEEEFTIQLSLTEI